MGRGVFLHDHDSNTFLHRHSSGTLHNHDTRELFRVRSSDGALTHAGFSNSSNGHHNHHNHHGHHNNSFFFLGIGAPFYSPFFYDPFFYGYGPYYPGFGFSYVGSHFGFSYASPWPYYGYEPYPVAYPVPVAVDASPTYAAAPGVVDAAGYESRVRSDVAEIPPAPPPAPAAPPEPTRVSTSPRKSEPDSEAASGNFARQGEDSFKSRDYKAAVRAWRHALLDESNNATLVMMLAQGLFAVGEYDEAAGAAQAAMRMLPPEKWGVVVGNYAELYTNTQDYVDQLKTLEKAVQDQPKDPARRFLVGFHYGYLGYPSEAVRELDKLVEMAPQDQLGRKLRDLMAEEVKKKDSSGSGKSPSKEKPPE